MNKENKQEENNKNSEVNFFKFTKQQLFINLEKYESVRKNNPTYLLGTNAVEPLKHEVKSTEFKKRLNSIDTSMLEDIAYTVLDDEDLKLEKRIENTEKILTELTEKLIVADTINDEIAKAKLLTQKKALMNQRENLLEKYKSQNLGNKVTAIYSSIINLPNKIKKQIRKAIKNFIKNSTILKKIKPLMRAIMVRDTLSRLNKINNSVDELVSMKVPFGEQDERYEALIMHLSRAGALHNKIKKELKKN